MKYTPNINQGPKKITNVGLLKKNRIFFPDTKLFVMRWKIYPEILCLFRFLKVQLLPVYRISSDFVESCCPGWEGHICVVKKITDSHSRCIEVK